MNNALELHNVAVERGGKRILNNVSFSIPACEFVTIVGANGAGKSTLLKSVLGFADFAGKIIINGVALERKTKRALRKKIAYMPQAFDVDRFFPVRVRDVISIGRAGIRAPFRFSADDDVRVEDIAKELGIRRLLNEPFGVISGGEKQKVMLAMTLAQEPEILLLDEPNLNLDIKAYKQFLALLERFHAEKRLTTVFVTHLIAHIPRNSRRIIVMREGGVKYIGASAALFKKKNYMGFIYD